MPRELVLGNGRLLVTFDGAYTLRDFYFPHVGKENHTIGHPCRTGVWVDGDFAWFADAGWMRTIRYRPDSLVGDVTLENPRLALRIHATDAVHPEMPILVRSFRVTNLASHVREVRLMLHYDLHISESEIGDTAAFEPVNRTIGHYKGRRYFVMNGRTGDGQGIFQYATGTKETGDSEGTWRDAEDGWLEMNPIAQGSVDSTMSLRQNIAPGATERFYAWIGAERDYWDVRALNLHMLGGVRALSLADADKERLAAEPMIAETDRYWREWVARAPRDLADLSEPVRQLFRRSLLVIATQIDHEGAIIAANDGDSMLYNRDTYSYMWPRDGALVARTLDRCGYHELTERFFRFCARLMPKQGYYPEGYLMHKFNADGSLGSSWHPWVRDGRPSLPIQEDETALVLWALDQHVAMRRDDAARALVRELAPTLVVPAARFLLLYRDDPEGRERFGLNWPHSPTGLPLASYDLWEERYGIHAFTVVSVCAGLTACGRLLRVLAEPPLAELADRCDAASARMRDAFTKHLWSAERRSFGRMLHVDGRGVFSLDATMDASTLYAMLAFGVFRPDEPAAAETIRSITSRLWCKTAVGGLARYENDYYHRQSGDIANVPGNPWIICTLWAALGHVFGTRGAADLTSARELLEWTVEHAQPSGILAEQVHPYTGAAMSVAPLTWSHATFAETVLAYCDAHRLASE